MSVPQLRRCYRWHNRLHVLGPPRNGPHDIGRRRPGRHRQHCAPRLCPERRPQQQMDQRSPARTLKKRIAQPGVWKEAGSPIAPRPTVASQSTPADSPMLPYSPCSPASAPSLLFGLTPYSGTGGFPGTPALPWLVRAGKCPWWRDASGGGGGYDAIAGARTRYTRPWKFPTHTPIAIEWTCGSTYSQESKEER
jgi:hypothetical protein